MRYYSTKNQSAEVDFREATINGQPPDGGLYFPGNIPVVDKQWLETISALTNEQIAFDVIKPYVGQTIPDNTLRQIVKETVDFPIPLVKIDESVYALELFHGPTLAFKDVGARFMSRCLGYFVKSDRDLSNRFVTVLVATSGDTGGAVANGFYKVEGVNVVILYPSGKVSDVQEAQLTTLGANVHALEIDGSFDDCQQMVKTAFSDEQLRRRLFLTSANSINVARWLPQQFYYYFAWKQWADKRHPPVISVPSGNFGNICAGLLAQQAGLPVKHFIAACNANDVVPAFLRTKQFIPRAAVATLSNAMDVGNPSNFIRILEIFRQELPALEERLSAISFDDTATRQAIADVFSNFNYILDPHGAIGWMALTQFLRTNPKEQGFFLETAHPVKFPGAIEQQIGKKLPMPPAMAELVTRKKISTKMSPSYDDLRDYLLSAR